MKKLVRNLSALSVVFIATFTMTGCNTDDAPPPDRPDRIIEFEIHGQLDFVRADGSVITSIEIEIADTDSARACGMMQRTSIPPQTGMLFIFEQETMQSFWMADTPLSLDIVFVNAEHEIVNIARYTRPYSPDQVPSRQPAQYVVEVQAGFVDRHGITEGDLIQWQRDEEA